MKVGTTVAGIGQTVETIACGGVPTGTFGSNLPSFGSLTTCGGPLGNCGTLGNEPRREGPALDTVHDPGGLLIFDLDQYKNGRRLLPDGDVEIYGPWAPSLGRAGQLADPVTDPRFIGAWYGAAAAAGFAGIHAGAVYPYLSAAGSQAYLYLFAQSNNTTIP